MALKPGPKQSSRAPPKRQATHGEAHKVTKQPKGQAKASAPSFVIKVVPSEVRSLAFRNIAAAFDAIRRGWIDGDLQQKRLLASGFEAASSGYANIMRNQVRANVASLYAQVTHGADFIPLVLGHCDAALRDEILRVVRELNLDTILPDQYGEKTERWRQTWEAMGLDADIDELLPKLRAAADQLALNDDSVLLAREWLDGYEFRLGEADRVRHLPGATRRDSLKALGWADDSQRDPRFRALDMVLKRIKEHSAPPYSPEVLLVEYDALMRISVESRLKEHFPERLRAWLDRTETFLSIKAGMASADRHTGSTSPKGRTRKPPRASDVEHCAQVSKQYMYGLNLGTAKGLTKLTDEAVWQLLSKLSGDERVSNLKPKNYWCRLVRLCRTLGKLPRKRRVGQSGAKRSKS